MPINKSQHFVPQHYLRQFRIQGTNRIAVARIDPFKFIPGAGIRDQCQQDYFYKNDGDLDDLLKACEQDLAPVLIRVSQKKSMDDKELVALRMLVVVLRSRTRKAVEIAKLFPKKIAYEVIKNAIETGRLRPPPSGEWKEDMMDFKGVAGNLIKAASIRCWLEMQTLSCKILEATDDTFFITSDNPVVLLNQLFSANKQVRSYVGFGCSGFQLLLPISAGLCLFFYDPKVYKVGGRRETLVKLCGDDVELVNSLQIQSAENCIYFNRSDVEQEILELAERYTSFRAPIRDTLKEYEGINSNETLFHFKQFSPKLKRPWNFCGYRKNVNIGPENRRNPSWSSFVDAVASDMDASPDHSLVESMEKILGTSFSSKNSNGNAANAD